MDRRIRVTRRRWWISSTTRTAVCTSRGLSPGRRSAQCMRQALRRTYVHMQTVIGTTIFCLCQRTERDNAPTSWVGSSEHCSGVWDQMIPPPPLTNPPPPLMQEHLRSALVVPSTCRYVDGTNILNWDIRSGKVRLPGGKVDLLGRVPAALRPTPPAAARCWANSGRSSTPSRYAAVVCQQVRVGGATARCDRTEVRRWRVRWPTRGSDWGTARTLNGQKPQEAVRLTHSLSSWAQALSGVGSKYLAPRDPDSLRDSVISPAARRRFTTGRTRLSGRLVATASCRVVNGCPMGRPEMSLTIVTRCRLLKSAADLSAWRAVSSLGTRIG